jgi:hypothetical protein
MPVADDGRHGTFIDTVCASVIKMGRWAMIGTIPVLILTLCCEATELTVWVPTEWR